MSNKIKAAEKSNRIILKLTAETLGGGCIVMGLIQRVRPIFKSGIDTPELRKQCDTALTYNHGITDRQ